MQRLIPRQCQALRDCGCPDARDSQCPDAGYYELDGRALCWVHYLAASNVRRRHMVRFIVLPDDMAHTIPVEGAEL